MRRNQSLFGMALVLVSISSVQLGGALAKLLFDRIDPAGLTLLRLTIAGVILVAICRPRIRSWNWQAWKAVIALGASVGAMNLTFYVALGHIPLGVAVTLELLGPLLLAFALSRKLRDAAWVLLAAGGVAIIGVQSTGAGLDLVGVILAIVAGGCWACYILASKRVGEVTEGLSGLAVAMIVGALIVAPFGAFSATTAIVNDVSLLLPILGVALLSSLIAYGIELLALRRISARIFGVLMALEPVAASLFGFFIVGEAIGFWSAAAMALIVAASAGVAFTAARAGKHAPPTTQTGPLPPLP